MGRFAVTVQGEMLGLSVADLRELGNWNPGVLESVYSSKIPMSSMVILLIILN